jgi:hypothetical protein
MKRTVIVFALCLMQAMPLFAQSEDKKAEHTLHHHNVVALFVGNTLIKPSGFNLPTIGIEYIRELNHHIGIGFMAEAEIGSHIIQVNENNGNVTELDRSGAILLIPAIFARVYKGLIVSVGYGVEFEDNENLGLLKVSLEYKLAMKNERFIVLPTVSWDHTNRFEGWVYGVNFGYLF